MNNNNIKEEVYMQISNQVSNLIYDHVRVQCRDQIGVLDWIQICNPVYKSVRDQIYIQVRHQVELLIREQMNENENEKE